MNELLELFLVRLHGNLDIRDGYDWEVSKVSI